MSVSTTRAAAPVGIAFEGGSVVGFKDGEAGVKELTLRYYDDIEALSDLVTAKNLANQSFGPVALNRSAELSCRRDTQPPDRTFVWQDEHGAVAAVDLRPPLVHLLKICSPTNSLCGTEAGHGPVQVSSYSLETVSRLRPFARRRFKTRRPFFVAILTRNPCVRLR